MPNDDQPAKTKAPASKKPREKTALESAATTIGATLGAIAVTTGIAHPHAPSSAAKPGKLVKKNKSRLPRKEKKRSAKASAKRS